MEWKLGRLIMMGALQQGASKWGGITAQMDDDLYIHQ